MNWEIIGSTGEWAGALIVVFTLVYLARQIRQSNLLAKAEAERDFFHTWHSIVRELGTDTTISSIVQRGLRDYSGLTAPEKGVFNTRIAAIFNETDLARRLCDQGFLSEDIFNSTLGVCVGIAITKGGSQWWEEIKSDMMIQPYVDARKNAPEVEIVPFDFWSPWSADDT